MTKKRCVLCWKPVGDDATSLGNSIWHKECWESGEEEQSSEEMTNATGNE